MEFQVPQFIEHKAKIVGFLTFTQFLYIGGAGGICFILYFSIGKTNFLLFIFLTIVLFLLAIALAFGKIEGRPLAVVFGNFLKFYFMPKKYFWKTKEIPPKIITKKIEMKIEEEKKIETSPLKLIERSQLKKLSTQLETKTR